MKLSDARTIADELVARMTPFCERVEIAGSIRREKSEVKDIEIVAIPLWSKQRDPTDLFGQERPLNELHLWATSHSQSGIEWIKPGTKEILPWQIRPDGKYWRGLLTNDLKVDLFLCVGGNWGVIFCIRTGSAEFSQALVTHAKMRTGWRIDKGHLIEQTDHAEFITPCYEEVELFDRLGLEYIDPRDRVDARAVRVRKAAV